jgi:hypothetical protein
VLKLRSKRPFLATKGFTTFDFSARKKLGAFRQVFCVLVGLEMAWMLLYCRNEGGTAILDFWTASLALVREERVAQLMSEEPVLEVEASICIVNEKSAKEVG